MPGFTPPSTRSADAQNGTQRLAGDCDILTCTGQLAEYRIHAYYCTNAGNWFPRSGERAAEVVPRDEVLLTNVKLTRTFSKLRKTDRDKLARLL